MNYSRQRYTESRTRGNTKLLHAMKIRKDWQSLLVSLSQREEREIARLCLLRETEQPRGVTATIIKALRALGKENLEIGRINFSK